MVLICWASHALQRWSQKDATE